MTKRWWVAVLDHAAARAAIRSEMREIPIPATTDATLPEHGDRVAILILPEALLVAVATAARLRPGGRAVLHLRDRIRAPAGHASDPFALRPLPSCATAWTRERLAEISGSFTPIGQRDGTRIQAAIRAQALAFGPAATRPAHDRPRTPGRRTLLEGRAASGTLGARRSH